MRRPAIPNCRSTWPHGQTRTGQAQPNRKFCSVPGPSSRTFGWIFAKMRHFVSHLSPGRGPFPSKFPNFGLQNVPTVEESRGRLEPRSWRVSRRDLVHVSVMMKLKNGDRRFGPDVDVADRSTTAGEGTVSCSTFKLHTPCQFVSIKNSDYRVTRSSLSWVRNLWLS